MIFLLCLEPEPDPVVEPHRFLIDFLKALFRLFHGFFPRKRGFGKGQISGRDIRRDPHRIHNRLHIVQLKAAIILTEMIENRKRAVRRADGKKVFLNHAFRVLQIPAVGFAPEVWNIAGEQRIGFQPDDAVRPVCGKFLKD